MRLRLDGHRLNARELDALLDEADLRAMSDHHVANGYRLCPVRAPRRMTNGTITFHIAWSQRSNTCRATLRLRVVMGAAPL